MWLCDEMIKQKIEREKKKEKELQTKPTESGL
jgi:hypothetical protein